MRRAFCVLDVDLVPTKCFIDVEDKQLVIPARTNGRRLPLQLKPDDRVICNYQVFRPHFRVSQNIAGSFVILTFQC